MNKSLQLDLNSYTAQLDDPDWRKLHIAGPVDELKAVANVARLIFIAMLNDYEPGISTEGTCAFSTILVKNMLETRTSFNVTQKGGDGDGDGGYFDTAGGHGHYWLEVDTPAGAYVVDITADQFGGDPVVVVPATSPQYVPGDQQLVDEQFIELTQGIMI